MVWVAKLGSALLIETGPCMHLHLVCSPPMDFAGYPPKSCLLVNVSTWVPKCDEACLLSPGDHPFLIDRSFVRYRSTCVLPAAELELKVANGPFKCHDDADMGLIRRVLACLETSDFAPGGMIKLSRVVWDKCKADGYW